MKQIYPGINVEAFKSKLSQKQFSSNSIKRCDGDPLTLFFTSPFGLRVI